VSRTARIVLAGVLSLAALVTGGVALAANSEPTVPSRTISVQQGGPAELRPAPDAPDAGCPAGGGSGTAAARL
jgi:hypothetical protein